MNQHRKFGLTVGTAFGVLALLLWWRDHLLARNVTAGLGAALVGAAALAPRWLAPIERGWMAVAHVLSRIMTPLLMGLVYYLSVVPIGFVMRILGKNPLKHSSDGSSFWIDRRATKDTRSDLERQF